MRRFISLAISLFVVLLFLSPLGAEENVKGTDEKTLYDKVVKTIERLETFYEREDISSFMNEVSKEYDGDYLLLEEYINDEFSQYDNFVINIKVDRVSSTEEKNLVFADTHWDKRRVSVDGGEGTANHGMTKFIFKEGPEGELLLQGMTGGTVFGEH
ncbi:MAG: hypothetical protein P8Y09_10540 [Deltaproteobacteria bacterium]